MNPIYFIPKRSPTLVLGVLLLPYNSRMSSWPMGSINKFISEEGGKILVSSGGRIPKGFEHTPNVIPSIVNPENYNVIGWPEDPFNRGDLMLTFQNRYNDFDHNSPFIYIDEAIPLFEFGLEMEKINDKLLNRAIATMPYSQHPS